MTDWWGRAYDRLLESLQQRVERAHKRIDKTTIGTPEFARAAGAFDEARKAYDAARMADKKARKEAEGP